MNHANHEIELDANLYLTFEVTCQHCAKRKEYTMKIEQGAEEKAVDLIGEIFNEWEYYGCPYCVGIPYRREIKESEPQ